MVVRRSKSVADNSLMALKAVSLLAVSSTVHTSELRLPKPEGWDPFHTQPGSLSSRGTATLLSIGLSIKDGS